jgi:hypothetical protein
MFYEIFGFRAVVIAVVFGSGAFALYGFIGILGDKGRFGKLSAVFVVGILVYAGLMMAGYLANPNYIDAGESHVTMLSLLLRDGHPIYSELDNPDLANTWYGPVLFIVNAVFLLVVPDPMLATKLRGILCFVAGLWLFFHFLSKRYGRSLAWLATGYVTLCFFIAFFFTVGNRADSLIISLTLSAVAGATIVDTRKAIWLAAICIAAAVNCKVTAVAYMFPIGIYMAVVHGWKPAFKTTFLAIGLFFVPFLVFPLFPIHHYLAYVMMATDNAFERSLLWENVGFSVFLAFPFIWMAGKTYAQGGHWAKAALHATLTTIFAMVLVCLSASKEGSGFYHLLAFAPGLSLLWIHFAKDVAASPVIPVFTGLTGLSWVWACFLLTWSGHWEFFFGFKGMGGENPGMEIRRIIGDYPGQRIAMGYGEGNDYSDRRLFFRPLLYKTTRDNPMNAVTMIEFNCSKQPIPHSALARFGNGTYDIFLVPRGEVPFTNSLFSELGVAEVFSENYEHVEDRQFFGVWRQK